MSPDFGLRAASLSCALATLAGCGGQVAPEADDTGTGDAGCGTAVVVTTDYSVYALATVDLCSHEVHDELATLPNDSFAQVIDGRVYIVGSFGADVIREYARGQYGEPIREWSVGDGGANPRALALCDGRLFVSLYGEDHLQVYNPDTGALTGSVDLSPYADADGKPEADGMVVQGGRLFVALQHFDPSWVSTEGLVAEVDCGDLSVSRTWEVGPSPDIWPHPADDGALLVRTGTYGEADGALSVLDLDDGEVVLLAEDALDYTSIAAVASGAAVAVGSRLDDAGATYEVGCTDLSHGGWTALYDTGRFLSSTAVSPAGEAWITSRTSWADPESGGGIQVVDVESCTLSDEEIPFSLDPYSVAFLEAE